jgi:hypothetical protein
MGGSGCSPTLHIKGTVDTHGLCKSCRALRARGIIPAHEPPSDEWVIATRSKPGPKPPFPPGMRVCTDCCRTLAIDKFTRIRSTIAGYYGAPRLGTETCWPIVRGLPCAEIGAPRLATGTNLHGVSSHKAALQLHQDQGLRRTLRTLSRVSREAGTNQVLGRSGRARKAESAGATHQARTRRTLTQTCAKWPWR